MKETTRATWEARVEEWKKSGKTAAEFAEGQPFSGGTLTWRSSQLRRKGTASSTRRRRTRRPQPKLMLAEVVRRAPVDQSGKLTIEVASVRISVSAGFDKALLREVVHALKEGQS